jgi:UDP-N-acetylglucosamine--dolichyl-phosphate N-acetylglucosaminephosphotransferase
VCIDWSAYNKAMASHVVQRKVPTVLLLALLPLAVWFVTRPLLDPVPPLPALQASVGLSIAAFVASIYLIPLLGPVFKDAGRWGKDLLKTDTTPV